MRRPSRRRISRPPNRTAQRRIRGGCANDLPRTVIRSIVNEARRADASGMSERTRPAPTGRRPRVLLVDDDPESLAALAELLEMEGIQVVGQATDGRAGIQAAIDLAPDVVLMDLRMERVGGIEATREITEAAPFTQVVILTAYDGPMPERSAAMAGAYAYLVKGCSAWLMSEIIHQAWQRSKEERRSRRHA